MTASDTNRREKSGGKTRPAPSSRSKRLSRDVILQAALRVLEAQGADALTVRSLGDELGIHATAFYRHFRDKDELLLGVADLVLAEVVEGFNTEVQTAETAVATIRSLIIRLRRILVRHPLAAEVLSLGPSRQPNEIAITEALLTLLSRAGLSREAAAVTYHVLIEYSVGSARIDAPLAGLPATERDATYRRWRADYLALSADQYPGITEHATYMYHGADELYEYGLDLILSGVNGRFAQVDKD